MNQATCPQRNAIAQYLLGALNPEEAEQMARHLSGCLGCQEAADQLDSASDELIDILRLQDCPTPYVGEIECEQALKRLTDLHDKYHWVFQPTTAEGSCKGEWEPPLVLGEYVLLERIGGHLGDVFKALHLALDRLVAVKTLPNDRLANPTAAAQFQQEIRNLGRLDHPNIVRALDARQLHGKWFLVMEYVDGCDLAKLVAQRGPLPIPDACELVRQAAVGLQYVCQKGLVHRDIKPANLMLSRRGKVKLLDLGLACFRIQQVLSCQTTGPRVVQGTPDYIAPEQVANSPNVDIRADIYSLGCTLYKLLANRAPFESPDCQTVRDKLNAHQCSDVPSIKQFRSEVPNALVALLDRMLAKNPADRFQTPREVAAALKPFTKGCNLQALLGPPEPQQPSLPKPSAPALPRSNRWFWELLALAAAVVLGVFGARLAIDRFGLFWDRTAPELAAESSQQPTPPAQANMPESNSSSPTTAATLPAFNLRAELNHPDGVYYGPPAGPDGKGELIYVKVTSDRPGYLYLLNQQADGALVCLFPNVYQPDNKIQPGQPVTIPDPKGDFNLRAGPPYGEELLVVLLSAQPLEPTRFGVSSLTDQNFTLVDRDAFERLRAALKQQSNTSAQAELKVTTHPGNHKPPDIHKPKEGRSGEQGPVALPGTGRGAPVS